jgi:choline-glycine betaine transporter
MKNLRYGHCIVAVALAAVLLIALGVSASTLGYIAILLACPLMMFVMMGSQPGSHQRDDQPTDHGQR